MWRRLQKFLPIVLIALAVQILAPIAGCWTALRAASDPLGAIPICHNHLVSAPGSSDQQDDHEHDDACLVCCVLNFGASVDAPQMMVLAVPCRPVAPVTWGHGTASPSSARTGSNAQARAPPQAI